MGGKHNLNFSGVKRFVIFSSRVLPEKGFAPMKPVICSYYLTYRCNARCGFCAVGREERVPKAGESSPDVVCRNLGDVRMLGASFVDFTGGEPLLYEGLPYALRYALALGLRTTVTTNGILYPERAGELAGRVTILQFSLHGPDRESHDAVTKTPSFDRVMEGVDKARSLGDRPTFIHTVTDGNIERVPEVARFAQSLKIPLFLNPCFSYFGNGGLSAGSADRLERMARGKGVTFDRGYIRFLDDGGNKTESPRCLASTSAVAISPDDCLILPCWHHEVRRIPIRGRLLALRNAPEAVEAREREGRYPFCEGCAVNCSIRASLFRRIDRYFLPSLVSAAEYLFELARSR
jgi:MoaA/NifB/PqqE/SkfB family radical SAM enzyme